MVLCKCGTKACNSLPYAKLPQAHHIHVSLHQKAPASLTDGGFVLKQAIKYLALVVYGGFRGIDIFWLLLLARQSYGSSTKGHHVPSVILYWKDYSSSEPVVPARRICSFYDKACLLGKFKIEALVI